jgi:hypothetical protein
MNIYVHRDGQENGPYTEEEARRFLAEGSLLADDWAWLEGASDWAPLSQVIEVVPPVPPPAPVPADPPAARPKVFIPPRRDAAISRPAKAAPEISMSAPAVPAFVRAPRRGSTPPDERRRQREAASSGPDPFKRVQRTAGVRNMGFGLLWMIAGGGIAYFSLHAASGPSNGNYAVTGGAFLLGGIQFLKGLIQFYKA